MIPPIEPGPSDRPSLPPHQRNLHDVLVDLDPFGSAPGDQPGLSPHQRNLHDALVDLDPSGHLARMYFGAVLVRHQPGNPDAISLSGHGLRELMEKLPRHLDVPMVQRLSSRVGALADRWKRVVGAPSEQRDSARAKFLEEAEKLAAWFVEQSTERTKRAGEVMDRLEQRRASLPEPVKQPYVDSWNSCLKVAEKAAHHGTVSPEEFDEHFQKVEDFLLDRLRPRTVEDQRAIEDIVREGEQDA